MMTPEIDKIMSCVDHTLLRIDATQDEIRIICDDAIKFKTASVCIAPAFVSFANEYLGDEIPVCTVIGFPNGYSTTKTKCFEASCAIQDGAKEIDMVINIGKLKDGNYDYLLNEIREVKNVCQDNTLKVIVETCVLTEQEKIDMCRIVSQSGADYIKTSTGFSHAGATFDDIALFAAHVDSHVKIKAAGGISSFDDAKRFIQLGASRLGTSRLVSILKNSQNNTSY